VLTPTVRALEGFAVEEGLEPEPVFDPLAGAVALGALRDDPVALATAAVAAAPTPLSTDWDAPTEALLAAAAKEAKFLVPMLTTPTIPALQWGDGLSCWQ